MRVRVRVRVRVRIRVRVRVRVRLTSGGHLEDVRRLVLVDELGHIVDELQLLTSARALYARELVRMRGGVLGDQLLEGGLPLHDAPEQRRRVAALRLH